MTFKGNEPKLRFHRHIIWFECWLLFTVNHHSIDDTSYRPFTVLGLLSSHRHHSTSVIRKVIEQTLLYRSIKATKYHHSLLLSSIICSMLIQFERKTTISLHRIYHLFIIQSLFDLQCWIIDRLTQVILDHYRIKLLLVIIVINHNNNNNNNNHHHHHLPFFYIYILYIDLYDHSHQCWVEYDNDRMW